MTGGNVEAFSAGVTQPRRRIAAVVLAAGESRRMGGVNKLLLPLAGRPLVIRAVTAALKSQARPVVVVVGHQAEAVRLALAPLQSIAAKAANSITVAHNPAFREGIASSIRAGITALPPGRDGAVFLLADMPWVEASHVDRLISAFDPAAGCTIAVATHQGRRGNPVLWGAQHFPALSRLSGDTGGRVLLSDRAGDVQEVTMPDAAVLADVDTPQDATTATAPTPSK
ncbi:MAG: nucleotidyltransferase family protein [Rhodospirillales bacterium]|nr:MAG: nucleotidyltransferase family protein [Rhodospirillales bacterium]